MSVDDNIAFASVGQGKSKRQRTGFFAQGLTEQPVSLRTGSRRNVFLKLSS
jgi:hypothetical protein